MFNALIEILTEWFFDICVIPVEEPLLFLSGIRERRKPIFVSFDVPTVHRANYMPCES